jgi:hypothetical protein
MSRASVGNIAAGRWTEPGVGRRDLDRLNPLNGPVVRCPGCGGKVFASCVLCSARRFAATARADRRRTAGRRELPNDERRRADPTHG